MQRIVEMCVFVLVFSSGILNHRTVALASDALSKQDIAASEIDRLIDERLHQAGIKPAEPSADAEFCRRVWLDLAGVAPPVAELRSFIHDTSPDKRSNLIDRLLQSSQHASHMATRWSGTLLPPDAQSQPGQQQNVIALQRWLRDQFRDNVPYDYLVAGFLTAGGTADSGPAVFYTSRELEPEKLAAATSQIFLGLQLQCAQCHDHPTDRWTQEDFWQYAAFFSQLEQNNAAMNRQSVIEDRPGGEVMLPDTDQVMSPRYPGVSEAPEPDPENIRRRQLTIWMASRDNPYLARAAVNRIWHQMFGRGIVDPVDQMDADNPPSHPELLDYLSAMLIENRFDLRTVYASIARTKAYQRSSQYIGDDRPAASLFAVMMVKTLSAEQFFDSLQQNVYRRGTGPMNQQDPAAQAMRQSFLSRMRSSNLDPSEYPHGVVQALGIMHGPETLNATDTNRLGLLASLEAPFFSDADRIDALFLATLSRSPTPEESQRFGEFLKLHQSSETRSPEVMSDLLWVLLNTAECALCP